MRRLERLIAQVRRLTDNEEFDNDPDNPLGITTQEIAEYLNDAQANIQASISLQHPKIFVKTETTDIVANQELYDLPTDLYLDGRLIDVAAKFSNQSRDYYSLKKKHIKTRLPDVESSVPESYIRIGNQIALQPVASQARTDGIRFTYQRKLPALAFRIGQVSATQTSGSDLTRIDLNASPTKTQDADLPTLADQYVDQFDEICVIDKNGNITAKGIPVSTFDSDNLYINVEEGHALGATESIAVGSYIVGGANATTHSELPDTCERYLIAYAAWKVLKADSMVDSRDQERELGLMLDEIIASFREIDEETIELVLDEDWLI